MCAAPPRRRPGSLRRAASRPRGHAGPALRVLWLRQIHAANDGLLLIIFSNTKATGTALAHCRGAWHRFSVIHMDSAMLQVGRLLAPSDVLRMGAVMRQFRPFRKASLTIFRLAAAGIESTWPVLRIPVGFAADESEYDDEDQLLSSTLIRHTHHSLVPRGNASNQEDPSYVQSSVGGDGGGSASQPESPVGQSLKQRGGPSSSHSAATTDLEDWSNQQSRSVRSKTGVTATRTEQLAAALMILRSFGHQPQLVFCDTRSVLVFNTYALFAQSAILDLGTDKDQSVCTLEVPELFSSISTMRLHSLILRGCLMEGNSLVQLVQGLLKTRSGSGPTLETLDLSNCSLSSLSAANLALLLPVPSSLRVLNLANNSIADEGLLALCVSLSTSRVATLDLSFNAVSSVGIAILAESLDSSWGLIVRELKLAGVVLHAFAQHNEALEHYSLFANILPFCQNLRVLDIHKSPQAFCNSVLAVLPRVSAPLEYLDFSNSVFSDLNSLPNLFLISQDTALSHQNQEEGPNSYPNQSEGTHQLQRQKRETETSGAFSVRPTLKHLNLSSTPLHNYGISLLGHCITTIAKMAVRPSVPLPPFFSPTALPGIPLESLYLDGTGFTAAALEVLAAALPCLKNLATLSISSNTSSAESAVDALARVLSQCRSLRTLAIVQSGLDATCAGLLAAGLVGTSVETLRVGYNQLGDEGVRALAAALPHTRIDRLGIEMNMCGDAGAAALGAVFRIVNGGGQHSTVARRKLRAVRELIMRDSYLGDESDVVMNQFLLKLNDCGGLEILDLGGCYLGPNMALGLASVFLGQSATGAGFSKKWLRRLDLSNNLLGDSGVCLILDALAHANTPDVVQNNFDDDDDEDDSFRDYLTLLPPVRALPRLEFLGLSANNVTDASLPQLISFLSQNRLVKEVRLLENDIGKDAAQFLESKFNNVTVGFVNTK
ncbi:hypothetical protein HDU84_005209 [Entophlyctis sp. JEL0112]|nr:hypothetical protein HDU84_005209 [Entophlyctis sp. JEL0112]